jgi:two-component system cell cycle sensor histidine kinase/response regulator CckA
MMRRLLPTIPREPLARFRLLALWFAVAASLVNGLMIAASTGTPSAFRVAGAAASSALAAWYMWGHGRRRFPALAWILESALMFVAGSASAMPLRALGLFYAASQFRALYARRAELAAVLASYALARVASIAFGWSTPPYEAWSSTVLFQVVGIVVMSLTVHLFVTAVERQREVERALLYSEEQLREAQKMEAVGRLAGGVAHDFNNLLTVINGHVFLLEQEIAPSPSAARQLDGINTAAARAAALTKQLLAFSRKQVLNLTLLNLNDLARDVEQMTAPLLGQRIRFTTSLQHALAPVMADAGQITQVVMNLALNARDAMPDGGQLTIGTSNVTIDATGQASGEASGHTHLPPGPYVRLTVRDTGTGMDAVTLARAFDPFFTTKPPGKGTGLGLASAYGIVKQSFGDIWAESTSGAGTTITMLLPDASATLLAEAASNGAANAEWAIPQAATSSGNSMTTASPRILLVEDDADVLAFGDAVLRSAGYDVTLAANGVEGLAAHASQGDEAFDLVVTDIQMPEMTGLAMIETLRTQLPNLPVLYVSAYTEQMNISAELRIAGTAFLEKPFTAGALTNAVARAVMLTRDDS